MINPCSAKTTSGYHGWCTRGASTAQTRCHPRHEREPPHRADGLISRRAPGTPAPMNKPSSAPGQRAATFNPYPAQGGSVATVPAPVSIDAAGLSWSLVLARHVFMPFQTALAVSRSLQALGLARAFGPVRGSSWGGAEAGERLTRSLPAPRRPILLRHPGFAECPGWPPWPPVRRMRRTPARHFPPSRR